MKLESGKVFVGAVEKGKSVMRSMIEWLDHRTGIPTAIEEFLQEDIPNSAGWHQVLGSVAMFSFLVQAVTGSPAGAELRADARRSLEQRALTS